MNVYSKPIFHKALRAFKNWSLTSDNLIVTNFLFLIDLFNYLSPIINKVYLMKLIALVLIILFVQIESRYIAFGEQAVNAIFKDRKDTLILFTTPSDSESSSQFVASSAIDEDRVYTTVDK